MSPTTPAPHKTSPLPHLIEAAILDLARCSKQPPQYKDLLSLACQTLATLIRETHSGKRPRSDQQLCSLLPAMQSQPMAAVRALRQASTLPIEDLCEAYPSLLERHLVTEPLSLQTAPGNARKTSGSYYTPPALVTCLLDEALDPALDDAADPIDLTVCDPACGTGHFLVAAAARIAARQPGALGHVLQNCIYGVDRDPIACELTRLRLWALDPTHETWAALQQHIQHGDALLGCVSAPTDGRIPPDAFRALTGDDAAVSRRLRARCRAETPASTDDSDRFCAAFFWPRTPDAEAHAPTTGTSSEACHAETRRIASSHRFLHWHQAFPKIMDAGGFSVVVGNPPWEKIKLHKREFFAHHPHIAAASTTRHRAERIEALKKTKPTLYNAFRDTQRGAEARALFARGSGLYPLGAVGDLNTYPLFLERALQLIRPGGRVGMIVKTGIVADYGMRHFFGTLLEGGQLVSVLDFSNKAGLFAAVVANERFTLLTLRSPCPDPPAVVVSVLNTTPETVREPGRCWSLSAEDISRINPNTRTCPLFQSALDAKIVRDIYRRCPVLLPDDGEPVWGARYARMLDMTLDSGHFRDEEALLASQGGPPRAEWGSLRPVLEGKLFDFFDHRYGDFQGVPRARRFRIKAEPGHKPDADKQDPTYAPLPRYWAPAEEADRRLTALVGHVPVGMLCFRDVCRTHTDARTLRVAICPPWPAGNKAPLLVFPGLSPVGHARRTCLLAAVLSSFAVDYVARQKFSGGSLNRYILAQLPVPMPIERQQWFIDRVVELTCTDDVMRPFAALCGHDEVFCWDEGRRAQLRAELDAAVMLLFGLERAEVEHIVGAFPILRRQEEARFGEHRSRRLVLERYDKLRDGR
ncbi:MAG: hypothetical protein ACI8S6_004461 [Myxococcota bacterium]|jgi:hypothetical protein